MPQKTPQLEKSDLEKTKSVGFDGEQQKNCGSFLQLDNKPAYFQSQSKGIEIMPTSMALKKYSWLKKYYWKAIDKKKDKYTKEVARFPDEGYFIRAKKGVKSKIPVQTCLYIKTKKLRQRVHNIIIAEENSSLEVITGCAISPKSSFGLHLGVSEFFVKKNATLNFTMLHNWDKNTIVRPRTVTLVEEKGSFSSKYISLGNLKDLQMYPETYLLGKKATASLSSVLLAEKNSLLDVGSAVFLKNHKTKAEILSRAISNGGKIIARGKIVGEKGETRGHLECQGLLLKKEGQIKAIPELEARAIGAELSHEAAIGKIAQEEIEYLMARGLSQKKAVSLIIQGFLNLGQNNLPQDILKKVEEVS